MIHILLVVVIIMVLANVFPDANDCNLRDEHLLNHNQLTNQKLIINKMSSLALLIGESVIIIARVSATNSFNSDVYRFFSESPTDKVIWMLIG